MMTNRKIIYGDYTIKDFFDYAIKAGTESYDHNGYHDPFLIVLTGDKNIVLHHVGVFFESEMQKDLFSKVVLPALLKTEKAIAYVVTSEAWITMHKTNDNESAEQVRKRVPMPSQDPNRIEVLMFFMETASSSNAQAFEIENGKIKEKLDMGGIQAQSRLTHILNPEHTAN